jgi:hypothetical protein
LKTKLLLLLLMISSRRCFGGTTMQQFGRTLSSGFWVRQS